MSQRMCGGGDQLTAQLKPKPEMSLAAGGLINQMIVTDAGNPEWIKLQTKVFNVQMLNSYHFRHFTGLPPLNTPVSAKTYIDQATPFRNV